MRSRIHEGDHRRAIAALARRAVALAARLAREAGGSALGLAIPLARDAALAHASPADRHGAPRISEARVID